MPKIASKVEVRLGQEFYFSTFLINSETNFSSPKREVPFVRVQSCVWVFTEVEMLIPNELNGSSYTKFIHLHKAKTQLTSHKFTLAVLATE